MTNPFAVLRAHQYIVLTTFRKNGDPVPTAVWFASDGGKIYVLSLAGAGKLKRIRNNPKVMLAPGNMRGDLLGPLVKGRARILKSDAERDFANKTLTKKYGFTKVVFDLTHAIQRALKIRQYIEITPE